MTIEKGEIERAIQTSDNLIDAANEIETRLQNLQARLFSITPATDDASATTNVPSPNNTIENLQRSFEIMQDVLNRISKGLSTLEQL